MRSVPKLCLKLKAFTFIPVVGEENAMCRAGQWASAGLAAAVLKLEWHFLSAAFQQTTLFCPFTRNLHDTQTPFTKKKNNSGHSKLRAIAVETDSGFGIRFMVRICQLIERSLKMRNRFLWHLHGGCTKEAAQGPKLCRLYFTCSERFVSFILNQSLGKGLGITHFNFPPQMITLTADRVAIWIMSLTC